MNPELIEALDNRVAMAETNLHRAQAGLALLVLVTALVVGLFVSVFFVGSLSAARGAMLPAAMIYAGLAWYKLLEILDRLDVAGLELAAARDDRSSIQGAGCVA